MNLKLIVIIVVILNVSEILRANYVSNDMDLESLKEMIINGDNEFQISEAEIVQSLLKLALNQKKIKPMSHTKEKRGHIWKRMAM